MNMEFDGYGYEWDAELVGGPADGCVDRVIQMNGEKHPPRYFKKMLDDEVKRESLGEKVIEHWASPHMDESTKVAIYELRGEPDEVEEEADSCFYQYVETATMGEARKKYGFV